MDQSSLDASSWPHHWCDAGRARSWIGWVAGSAAGPVEVFRVKPWGVTAAFVAGATPVVFHACRLPLFGRSPRIYEMLGRACPDRVPELLAATERDGQTWTLFRLHDGRLVGARPSRDGLVAVARATAEVQAAVAALPEAGRRGLPRSPVDALPERLEDMIADVGRRHPRARHVIDRMQRLRTRVRRWTDELLAGGWPDSVDHTDLHARNAVMDDGGGVRILDWEEAVIGLPFFSLDRLLADAEALGCTAEVRDAYLAALPWRSLAERRRALGLALALAPIKAAHECRMFERARGRPGGNPYLMDFFTLRLLRRRVSAA